MRRVINFNDDWYFSKKNIKKVEEINCDNILFARVNLPHSHKIVPHHYFSEKDYEFVSWYKRNFSLNNEYRGKRFIIEFDGIMKMASIYINGQFIGEHKGGYTSFSFDISEYIEFETDNTIAVRVDATRRRDIPPEGNLVDYLLFGGIYRDVRLLVLDKIYIEDAFLRVKKADEELSVIKPLIKIRNYFTIKQQVCLKVTLFDKDRELISVYQKDILIKEDCQEIEFDELYVNNPYLWCPENPYLYNVKIEIIDKKGKDLFDNWQNRIGLRVFEFKKDGKFYINNKPLKLRGLNRHQMYPYLGNAVPSRYQKKDADILKYELGLNFVRSSHYPPSPHFLDRCDEIGLLVMEETPGWQYIGNEDWQNIVLENVAEMIIRDRNHASVFIWGVRVNESEDCHKLYKETNEIAHNLDDTRLSCGVRNFQESEFLEDVFTYNDFEYNREGKIHKPNHKPYIITEYMGHMYPTKSYDSVERQIKHALLHARIQDQQYANKDIAGACGWCAFDYNTHADFGSGDRICYHGVSDIFRLPKFAAYFYQSQIEPEIDRVIFIARYLTPSFNEDYGDEIVVFSNCDEVELYIGDKYLLTNKPDREAFPNLPHPPFVFKGCKWWEWGASTISSLKAVGKIKGEKVAEHTIYPFDLPHKIVLKADYQEISADGSDLTRVIIELQDRNKQVLYLAHHSVSLQITGPGELIGESPFSLEAGRGAVFIRSIANTSGLISLKAQTNGLSESEIIIKTKQN